MSGVKIGTKATITNPAQAAWLIQRVQRRVNLAHASCAAGGGTSMQASAVPRTASTSPQATRAAIAVAVSRGLRKTSLQRFLPNVVVCPIHGRWKVFRQSIQTVSARRFPEVLTHRRPQKLPPKKRAPKNVPKKRAQNKRTERDSNPRKVQAPSAV